MLLSLLPPPVPLNNPKLRIRQQPAPAGSSTDSIAVFQVGVAQRDITPSKPVPMWGYGARHDKLSCGVLDPLLAKALVIEAGQAKLAIVGMDLGRGPTPAMIDRIRQAVARKGISHVLICGSHTHHGPVIELTDQPGFGKGKFDDAVAYARSFPSGSSPRFSQPTRVAGPPGSALPHANSA